MKCLIQFKFLLEVYRLHGVIEMLQVAWSGLINKGGNRLILLALKKPRKIERALQLSKDHDFHFATVEELSAFKGLAEYDIEEFSVDWLRRGIARCLLQMDGDKLTGYAWVWNSKLAYIIDGVYINLPAQAIYNFKALTLPEYRGCGYQGLRHLKLLELLKAEGVDQLFGYVHHLNTRSLHGVKKSGYEKVGELNIRHRRGLVQSKLTLKPSFWSGVE